MQELDELQEKDWMEEEEILIARKEKELEKLINQEEIYWHQRAKRQWLSAGDANTTFFHRCTKARRARNAIQKLIDESGRQWTNEKDIEKCIIKYYNELFSSSRPM